VLVGDEGLESNGGESTPINTDTELDTIRATGMVCKFS